MSIKESIRESAETVEITQTSQGSTNKQIEQEEEAVFGVPDKQQRTILKDLAALYYALLGPQSLVETTGNISRPLYPVVTKNRPR
jgi:hypothetical protein